VTVLALLLFAFWIVPQDVVAQSTNAGISILQITPAEASGPVGTNVNVQGTIYTSNGYYQVLLNRQVVANGKAEGYYVNANFTVPGLPAKMYPLILRDVAINMNSTGQFFTVSTGYTITSSSVNIQEGASVTIVTSITGAHSGTLLCENRSCSPKLSNNLLKNNYVECSR